MKINFLLPLLLLTSLTINAQTYLGGHGGISYLFGLKPMAHIGLNFTTPIREEMFQFGFNYHLPVSWESETYYDPINSSNSQKEFPYTRKISMFDVHVYWRYYFSDNEFKDGGFYGLGGGAFGFATSKDVPGDYDKANYKLSSFFDEPVTHFFQPYVCIGIGYDKMLENDHVFGGQFMLNLNATSFNSRTGPAGDPTVPSFIGLKLMYSLPIGD